MATVGKKKGCKPGIALARQAFLYGDETGRPVTSTARLCEIAGGMHENSIARHMQGWIVEREEMVASASKGSLALHLSKETLDAHNSDMIHLRDQLQQIKWEIDHLDDSIEKLANICENFSLNGDNADAALRIFENYLRASHNKSSLRKQFLATQKQWTDLAGIVALSDIQVTAAKEVAKGRAKLEVRNLTSEGDHDEKPDAQDDIFQRRGLPGA